MVDDPGGAPTPSPPVARGLAETEPPATPVLGGLDGDRDRRRTFFHLLTNTLVVSVINYTLWFAVTFYVYLQTRSVFATGMIAGIFLAFTALSGIWFGSLVDHHKKKQMMLLVDGRVAHPVCAVPRDLPRRGRRRIRRSGQRHAVDLRSARSWPV